MAEDALFVLETIKPTPAVYVPPSASLFTSFKGTVTFTRKSFQIALKPRYKRLYAAR